MFHRLNHFYEEFQAFEDISPVIFKYKHRGVTLRGIIDTAKSSSTVSLMPRFLNDTL